MKKPMARNLFKAFRKQRSQGFPKKGRISETAENVLYQEHIAVGCLHRELKDYGMSHVKVHTKGMCHLMFGMTVMAGKPLSKIFFKPESNKKKRNTKLENSNGDVNTHNHDFHGIFKKSPYAAR